MTGYEQLMANLRQFNPDVIAQRAGGNQQREREIRAQQMGSTPAEAGAGITPPYIISNLGSPNLNESVSVYWRMWRNYSLLIKDKFRLFKIYDELARARVVRTNSSLPGTKLKKLELSDLRPPSAELQVTGMFLPVRHPHSAPSKCDGLPDAADEVSSGDEYPGDG